MKDGHAEQPFLIESQDEAACVMGGLVEDTAVGGPMGLALVILPRATSGEKERWGEERSYYSDCY